MKTDILIIGGGLSGLSLADQLQSAGRDFVLVDARERFGGRIKTGSLGSQNYDLGPAWFWPGQPRIASLIQRMGLDAFDQFARGDLIFEDDRGQVQRGRGYASMEGSWRLKSGLSALTDALADRLPDKRKLTGTRITDLRKTAAGIIAQSARETEIEAQVVVFAAPPRLIAEVTRFEPALTQDAVLSMQAVPTWMAGQAKAVAVYETAFWRDQGLSGDAMSRVGPMVEIHDASPSDTGPYALFGFIGVPPKARQDVAALNSRIIDQFARLFGEDARSPLKLFLKDWAFDPMTATEQDQVPLHMHPRYGLPGALEDVWDGRLVFAGTEVALEFGGYLEGALEAAEIALHKLQTK